MGMFAMEGSSGSRRKYWNYSNQEKDDFKLSLKGTVVEVLRKQGRDFMTGEPKTWPNGDPKPVYQIAVKQANGEELNFCFDLRTYNRKTKERPFTQAAGAIFNALKEQGYEHPELDDLLGKEIQISTQVGNWSFGNHRRFGCQVFGEGDVSAVRGVQDLLYQSAKAEEPVAPKTESVPVELYQDDIPF
jgi:hypothetical protein